MSVQVAKYAIDWNTGTREGCVRLQLSDKARLLSINCLKAPEFLTVCTLLNRKAEVILSGEEGVVLRLSGSLDTESSFETHDLSVGRWLDSLEQATVSGQPVIDFCEQVWGVDSGDCSKFVRDVAHLLSINLSGSANEIADQIQHAPWRRAADGVEAKMAADQGALVIGALKGNEQTVPSPHGHVVVVVSGPLADAKYPTAYWGTLGGKGERYKTVNWAWNAQDRDKVNYYSIGLS